MNVAGATKAGRTPVVGGLPMFPGFLSRLYGCLAPREVLARCHLVCVQWRQTRGNWSTLMLNDAGEALLLLQASVPSGVRSITLETFLLSLYGRLGTLQLEELILCQPSHLGAVLLPTFSTLAILKVHMDGYAFRDVFTEQDFKYLHALPCLTELEIWAMPDALTVSAAGLDDLAALQLVRLHLHNCVDLRTSRTRDINLALGLRELELTQVEGWTNAAMGGFWRLQNLKRLSLHGCREFSAEGMRCLPPHLTSLDLTETFVGEVEIRALATFPALVHLTLARCLRLTDEGLGALRSCVQLQSLSLDFCRQLGDAALAHIAFLVNLHDLGLNICERITDAGLRHVACLPALVQLWIVMCPLVTEAGLSCLDPRLRVMSWLPDTECLD